MPSSGSLSIRPPKKLGLQNLPEFQTKHVSRPGFELTTSRTGDVRSNQLRQSDMPKVVTYASVMKNAYLSFPSGYTVHSRIIAVAVSASYAWLPCAACLELSH